MDEAEALTEARDLLSGGEELAADEIAIRHGDGHSGLGWYAWFSEYPEEGSVRVD